MGKQSEENYIRKRKRKAKGLSALFCFFWILPMKKNKVVFTAFEGDGGYCCNPRYIAEEMLKGDKEYNMVWLVNDTRHEFPQGIRKVKNTLPNRVFHLATAGIWIDNSRKAYGTVKRKKQIYIQTWHAALEFKPVGKFRGKLFPKMAYLVSEYDSNLANYVLSNSDWCTKLYPEMLLYHGEIIKTGSPRCDILINRRKEMYREICKRYSIPQEAKIVMYAPTFRGGSQKGKREVFAEAPTIDFEQLVKVLSERFGGQWYVFLRLHPQLSAQLEKMPLAQQAEYMVDVSRADDMNEVMAGCDVFITDYSSSAFDAINCYMPVFLYADDLETYVKERGQLMWDINALPFRTAKTNEELWENIRNYDDEVYRKNVKEFLQEHGVLEDGKASRRVVEKIKKTVYK